MELNDPFPVSNTRARSLTYTVVLEPFEARGNEQQGVTFLPYSPPLLFSHVRHPVHARRKTPKYFEKEAGISHGYTHSKCVPNSGGGGSSSATQQNGEFVAVVFLLDLGGVCWT